MVLINLFKTEMEVYMKSISDKVNAKVTIGFRICFPAMRLFVGLCNLILVLLGGVVLISAGFMYIVPRFHLFLDALKHIFNVHTIFGSAIILGGLTVCIGAAGILFLWKCQYEKLGLQAATFLVLLIVMAAIAFTFWTEWRENAHFGISYATQSYNPYDKQGQYFKSIQEFLSCCGSSGPGDYDIANEHYNYSRAPTACCNHYANLSNCTEIIKMEHLNNKPQTISVHMAFQTGCMYKMEKVIWPIIVYIIFIQSGLSMLCMLVTAILIIGYQACVKSKCTHLKDQSDVVHSNSEYEESIKLEYKN